MLDLTLTLKLLNKNNLDNIDIKRIIEFFENDSASKNEAANEVYVFYRKLVLLNKYTANQTKIHLIANRYLNNAIATNIKKEPLLFLEMNYYYEMSAYDRCLYYANLLIDADSYELTFKLAAISYVLTIFFNQNLIKDAYTYIDKLMDIIKQAGDYKPHELLIFIIDAIDIYAKAKDFDKYQEYLLKYQEIMKNNPDFSHRDGINFCFKMHKIYHDVELSNENPKNVLKEINNILNNFDNNYFYIDEYCSILIPIFRYIKDLVTDDDLVNYVNKILKYNQSLNDKLSFYSFLIDEVKIDMDKYYAIYLNYTFALKEFYRNSQIIKETQIESELSTHKFKMEYDNLKEKYHLDILTSCYNRLILKEINEEIVENDTAVLYFDIDNLKTVNDKYGHYVGDLYIQTFANELLKHFKFPAKCIRYGGDEFVVIYPNTNDEEIKNNVKILEESCAKIKKLGGYDLSISSSNGYYFGDGINKYKDIISKADAKMYLVKKEKKQNN